MNDVYTTEREIVEFDLNFVRKNKRTFFDASSEAMQVALEIGQHLHGAQRHQFAKVIECITTHDAIVECL